MVRASLATSLAILVAFASVGCNKDNPGGATTSASSPSGGASAALPTSASAASATPSAAAAVPAGAGAKKEPVVTFKNVGLATPESVLYDDTNDLYLVSNINGKPLDADGNGFISKFTPDGAGATLKWIEGGKNKVTLNAPKGMAIVGDLLYVADLDTVRIFDRKTGSPAGDVKVPGAVFLNDLAVTSDGRVLVSDTGMKATATGFAPAGTDAVYAIDKAKKLTTLAKAADLGAPNGLLSSGDKTWVVTFGSGELYTLDAKGKKTGAQKLPKGSLDGLLQLPGGDLLISSWEANAIYRGRPGGDFTPVIENVKSPADIGWDPKRSRVLVPLFESNEVQAFEIK